jgi:hypothetical protein
MATTATSGKKQRSCNHKQHRGTIEPENATFEEVTTRNTPVQQHGRPLGQGQGTETPSMAQQIGTLNIGCDKEDLTTDAINIGTTHEVQGSDYNCEM